MRILVALGPGPIRDSFFTPRALAALERHAEVVLADTTGPALDKVGLLRQLPGCDVLFSGWETARVDRDVLEAAPELKIHAHAGGSVAPFVSKEEFDRGVTVLTGNAVFARSVAEGCLCFTLLGLRRMTRYWGAVAAGGWRPETEFHQGLLGKSVGLVGFGAIAGFYARLLAPFGVDLRIASQHLTAEAAARYGARLASAEEIFSECEVISLHSALNDQTRGRITAGLLARIADGALLVNTARAGLIEDGALLKELETRRFEAVLDVFDEEPLAVDSPYRRLENVTVLPHIAGPTFDQREQVVLTLLEDLLRLGRGESARNAVDWDYARRMTVADPSQAPR